MRTCAPGRAATSFGCGGIEPEGSGDLVKMRGIQSHRLCSRWKVLPGRGQSRPNLAEEAAGRPPRGLDLRGRASGRRRRSFSLATVLVRIRQLARCTCIYMFSGRLVVDLGHSRPSWLRARPTSGDAGQTWSDLEHCGRWHSNLANSCWAPLPLYGELLPSQPCGNCRNECHACVQAQHLGFTAPQRSITPWEELLPGFADSSQHVGGDDSFLRFMCRLAG